ncbi:extracellular solute-binding protein [Paenibacillus psychroresistens]|uniref:Extracellular solute-binding protein n=1 Tax=Paenibacillus psychroresistens TaxID=1778678 RepID=A0A6B8RUC5_9BACL|nr:extracellular solute-binding protein [Paenibacillus psychroresistens]QGQ99205.1 extracellular solute-binding protein [Paenibacillus psychroresistens]
MKKPLIILLFLILSGCFNNGNNLKAVEVNNGNEIKDHVWQLNSTVNNGQNITLKVALISSNSSDRFMQFYGTPFMEKYKNISIEFVNIPAIFNEDMKKTAEFLAENDADLMVSSLMEYQNLANSELLLDITSLSKIGFDMDQFVPIAIDQLMDNNTNSLFGLAPGFSSVALYYNKDLFDKNQITYPHGNMSWNELFQLADQFPKSDNTYGLFLPSYGTIRSLAMFMAISKNLAFLDKELKKVTVDNSEWEDTYSLIVDGIKGGILPDSRKQGDNLFVAGKAAMTIDYVQLLKNLTNSTFKWGVSKQPEGSTQIFSVGSIYSVLIHSKKQEAALELLKYINSDEIMKANNSNVTGLSMLPSRLSLISENGVDLSAFYDPSILSHLNFNGFSQLPMDFSVKYDNIFEEEMNDAILGKKPLNDALRIIQKKAQKELDNSWQNQR